MNATPGIPVLPPGEGYERWAPSYDLKPNPLLAAEERTLLDGLPPLRGLAVLDLGCGSGRWLEHAVGAGAHGLGIDFSHSMLRQACRKAAVRASVACGEFTRLPVRDTFADVVICSFCFEHCGDIGPAVAEVARVTKPTCSVFISQLHPDAHRNGWRCGFRDEEGPAEIAAQPHTVAALSAAFQAQRFTLSRIWEPHLSEAEFPLFVDSGRESYFQQACALPAVLICEFTRGER